MVSSFKIEKKFRFSSSFEISHVDARNTVRSSRRELPWEDVNFIVDIFFLKRNFLSFVINCTGNTFLINKIELSYTDISIS